MKELIFTFISLGALCSYAQNFPLRTDVQEAELNGKVKRVTEITTYEGNVFKGVDTTFCSFNEKGFVTESETRSLRFFHQDTIRKIIKNVADYKKRRVVMTTYDTKGKEIEKKIKKTNEKGFPIEVEMIHNKTKRIKMFYHYAPKSCVVTITTDSKETRFKGLLSYDAEGRLLTEETYIDEQVRPINKLSYTYNRKGFEEKRVVETFFPNEDKRKLTYRYRYDTEGSAAQIKQYEEGTLIYTSERRIEYY